MVLPKRSTEQAEATKYQTEVAIFSLSSINFTEYNTKASKLLDSAKRVTDMVIPGLMLVVDNSSSKTPCRVNASASDWDGGQVNHEHSKSNGKWSQNLRSTEHKT